MSDQTADPVATAGFEFVEFTAPDARRIEELFATLGFSAIARHRSKDVTLYRQGEINFILNREPNSFAQAFARVHGPSVCAFAIRVQDAGRALERACRLGAEPYQGSIGPMELNIPAVRGVGGSLIYLVDHYDRHSIYDVDFVPLDPAPSAGQPVGLSCIDHLTHNVHAGRMDHWARFYERLFDFHEVRYFDIRGASTGLHSRAMASPCGRIRIPINEPTDAGSQIQEYLDIYHGEGVQHIALATRDIYGAVEALRARGVAFLEVPDTYYEAVDQRVRGHGEDLRRLQRDRILIDGAPGQGLLLQIFTRTLIGPIFFEIIERRGNESFGEGNFRALFEAMERDQAARGVI